jgi:hypothetical protein
MKKCLRSPIKGTIKSIKVQPQRIWVVEVDASQARFDMFLKQFLFELFKPFVLAFLFLISYAFGKKVGIFKITNNEQYKNE